MKNDDVLYSAGLLFLKIYFTLNLKYNFQSISHLLIKIIKFSKKKYEPIKNIANIL